MKISGIVLAGGKSRRMGQDKTLLTFGNETLIERVIGELRQGTEEVIIAGSQTDKYNIPGTREVADAYPGMGPLAGLHAGLTASHHPYAVVVSSDLPLFRWDLARYLLNKCAGFDVVVPDIDGYLEPLCAVYAKSCLPAIESCLQNDVRKIICFYPLVRVLRISGQELSAQGLPLDIFYNLNTPEDYRNLLHKKTGSKKSQSYKEPAGN